MSLFPMKYEVCSRCDGHGTHTNPAIDGNGITGSELAEILHDDPDFLDDYRAGMFNIPCEECQGKRVVYVPDVDSMTQEQYEEYREDMERSRYEAIERAAELRIGA